MKVYIKLRNLENRTNSCWRRYSLYGLLFWENAIYFAPNMCQWIG